MHFHVFLALIYLKNKNERMERETNDRSCMEQMDSHGLFLMTCKIAFFFPSVFYHCPIK